MSDTQHPSVFGVSRQVFIVAALVAALLLAGGALLFRYQYRTFQHGAYVTIVRIDRWTGAVQECTPPLSCPWEKTSTVAIQEGPGEELLPYDQAVHVRGNMGLTGYGDFSGKIYNGSNWHVTRMILQVVASRTVPKPLLDHYPPGELPLPSDAPGETAVIDSHILWNRRFNVNPMFGIAPLSTGDVSVSVPGDEPGLHFTWNITRVYGHAASK